MAKLVFMGEHFGGQVYELRLERTTVGRSDHNNLVIRDDSVSAHHCEILVFGPEVIIRDLDSRNGTFINGTRLNKQAQAKSGHIVRFGLVEACLELEPTDATDATSELSAVYSLGKIQREQRREHKKPKPPESLKLVPASPADAADHTVIIARKPQPAEPAAAPEPPARSPAKGSKLTRLLILVAVVVGLALLLWWLLKRP